MTAQDINWTAKTIMGGIYVQQKITGTPMVYLITSLLIKFLIDLSKKQTKFQIGSMTLIMQIMATSQKNLKGLGPYYVSEWEPSQYVTLLRKENWWGAGDSSLDNKAFPEKIIFKIIKEDASSYLALKNQEIDVTTNIGTVTS